MRTKSADVVVVGGGVIGLACAYYLHQHGRQVVVLDQEAPGAGASHGNCGLVFVSDLLPLCSPNAAFKELARMLRGTSSLYIKPAADWRRLAWLLRFAGKCRPTHLHHALNARYEILNASDRLFDRLLDDEHLDCDWQRHGVLLVFRTERHLRAYADANSLLAPFGLAARQLTGTDLRRIEPALRNDLAGAWYHEADAHLRPDRLIAALAKVLRAKGVDLIDNCTVTGLIQNGGRTAGVRTTRGRIGASAVVLAAGAWSADLGRAMGLRLPIQPGKGYSMTLDRPSPCPVRPCYLYERNVVATPFSDGLRLGGTMEFSGFNTDLNHRRLGNLTDAAHQYLRTPVNGPVREQWAALRPMCFDDLPIIGPSPRDANLFVASGHGMMGVSMATGTGRLIAEMVCGRRPHIDPHPFRVDRFFC